MTQHYDAQAVKNAEEAVKTLESMVNHAEKSLEVARTHGQDKRGTNMHSFYTELTQRQEREVSCLKGRLYTMQEALARLPKFPPLLQVIKRQPVTLRTSFSLNDGF